MKKLLFIAVIVWSHVGFGQSDSTVVKSKQPILVAKVDLINVANPEDPSVLVSAEFFPFISFFSVSQEVGFVTTLREEPSAEVSSSFKYRGEFRFYTPPSRNEGSKYFGIYLGGSYQYRQLTLNDRYILGFECDGDCVYYQNFEGDIQTTRNAYQMHVGVQSRSDRFIFETDFGFGYYVLSIDKQTINGGETVESNRYLSKQSLGQKPYLSFRLKVGCVLFRK